MGVTESLSVSQWFRCLFAMVSLPSELIAARCGTWNSVSPHGATLRAIGSPRPFIPLILQPPVQLFKSTMRVPPLVVAVQTDRGPLQDLKLAQPARSNTTCARFPRPHASF